jgi:hypothetical protein
VVGVRSRRRIPSAQPSEDVRGPDFGSLASRCDGHGSGKSSIANKKGARRRPFGEYEQEVLSAATATGGVATESEAGKA